MDVDPLTMSSDLFLYKMKNFWAAVEEMPKLQKRPAVSVATIREIKDSDVYPADKFEVKYWSYR